MMARAETPLPERTDLPTVRLLGIEITNATQPEAVTLLESWMRAPDRRARVAFIVNAHTLNTAYEDARYRTTLNAADVVFGDGTGVRWAASLKGVRIRDNLVGTDLLPEFFRRTHDRAYRYFLLGGGEGVARRAAERLVRDFPGVRVVGHHEGYLSARETPVVIDRINAASPHMLLVAMGNPLQERWIEAHRARLRVPVCIGVGGLFDHWAGGLRRAPRWVRRLGIEWVQLLAQQPHKWRRYLLGNPKFLRRALADARRGNERGERV